MDLTNLFGIYGKPNITSCPVCNGEGCESCNNFGYIATLANNEVTFTFDYPFIIEAKKRDQLLRLRNIVLAGMTALFILSLVISYLIIFNTHG